ncbi:S8 family serine peptidase [Flavobacterium sp.]|jgi:serine protease AprX|uniref:S8 family serine peptidase n=1 Tax=Flavobacterium sp. TaxID=239 RepID=UPI0037BF9CC0
MKKQLLFVLLIANLCYSQEDAWVFFANKPNAATYLANPLTMLTQRSLDRRAVQGISLDLLDVPIAQTYIDQVIASTGITVMAKSKWLNALHVRGTQANIQALANLTFVGSIRFANHTLNGRYSNAPIPISPVQKQIEVTTTFNYGSSANQIQMLNGHLLHQQDYTGTGKIIAVLDSGFQNVNVDAPFQRLFTNNLIVGGYNYVSQNTNVYALHNHGTMVLSCMGGYVEGQLVGTAPDAQYYLFVTEDVASENPVEESYWVEAAEEADRLGADIITSSLGYFTYDNPSYSHTYNQMTGNFAFASRGANIAFLKGMVVIASAGNSGATSNPYIGVPAEATHVLAVGAVGSDEMYAPFSSIGPAFDGRVKPDIMAQGQAAVVANIGGAVVTANGTSFSAPIMAGLVASFWSAVPNLSARQVVQLVKQSSDKYTVPSNLYGYGIPDFQLALTTALRNYNFEADEYVIYPNPMRDELKIELPPNAPNARLYLYNNLGQKVCDQLWTSDSKSIDVSHLSSGIYIYELLTNNKSHSGKIIKK